MKVSLILPFLFLFSSLFAQESETLESKGAIIIASLEGQVVVTNNVTQAQLPSSQVKAGGLLFDGHTVKTGPASKVILLLSNGTVSTIKADSALNIKKFTQEKFDPGRKKLSEMKGEPSSSQTVLDLELGDMVFDVKKLDKRSSFNIESPVGTAGIRGTSGQMGVMANNGATNLNINMFKGSVATRLRGSDIATMVRQGQSFSAGISASGVVLPPTLGQVPTTLLASIEADLEASEGATGVTSVGDSAVPAGEGGENVEDEAPSEEELQEQDAEQAAAAKGLGDDDNGTTEAVALDKAGLIDLDDADQVAKVELYVEATTNAAGMLAAKQNDESGATNPDGSQRVRRNNDGTSKDSKSFLSDLVTNLDDVVDVSAEADEIGIDKSVMFEGLLENSENSGAVKDVVAVAGKIGTKDKSNMLSVFTNVDQADSIKEVLDTSADLGLQDASNLTAVLNNADKADDLKSVMDVAKKALGSDDGSGSNKLDTSSASILASTLQNADQADQLNEVMEASADLGLQDASNLTAVFSNADKASDLKAVMDVAKETLGSGESGSKKLDASSASILASTLQNADKADSMKSVMDDAEALGAQNAENLTAVFSNADKASDLKAVMEVAKEALGSGESGSKKLNASNASVLASTLQNADKADSMKSVMDDAEALGVQNAENLTAVFANADQANDLRDVMSVAKANLGTDDGTGVKKFNKSNASILTNTLKSADKASDLKDVVNKAESAGAISSLGTMLTNADQATDLKEVVAKAESAGASASLGTMFANADKATDLKDVVSKAESAGASASLGTMFANADKATDLKEVVAKAESAGASASLGTMFANADKATDLKEVVAKAESAGASASLGTMFANADQASDLAEMVEKAETAGASASLGTMFANADKATDLKGVVAKAETAGASASLGKMFANADQASDLAEMVEKAENAGASSSLGTMFANADKATDLKGVVAKAETAGASASLGKMFANADQASDLAEMVEKAETAGASASLGTMFANADKASDLADVVTKAEAAGASASLGAMFANADKADSYKRVTDQLNSVGLESGLTDVFDNIADVADVFDQVAGESGATIDQDFAKNILGNANDAGEVNKAIKLVQENGGASDSTSILNLAKKDVSELKAINKVAEEFEGSSGALEAFVSQGLDQALQLEKAFENGDIDSDSISSSVGSGGTFSDVVGNSVLEKLRSDYASNADILEVINLNPEKAQDINFALSFVSKGSAQESALFANLDKIAQIMSLSNRFESEPTKLAIVYNNLDVAASLDQMVSELSIYPKRIDVLMANADMAPSILDAYNEYDKIGSFQIIETMFSSSENLKQTLSNDGLVKLLSLYPEYATLIESNSDKAGEISGLIALAGEQYAQSILSNLDQFESVEVLVLRTKQDSAKLDLLFANIERLSDIKNISDKLALENIPGGQNALFSNLDAFKSDPGYYLLALDEPRFLVRLHEITGDLKKVSSTLAYELVALNLSRAELVIILGDLIEGPESSGPNDNPPNSSNLEKEFNAVSLLESHTFNGQIPSSVVLNEDQIRASSLFQETLDIFDAISAMDNSPTSTSSADSQTELPMGVIGGVNLSFSSGDYDLSNLGYLSYAVAASGKLSLQGTLNFTSTTAVDELLFISAETIELASGSSIDFGGNSLGLGSFDSLNIVNVDLHADGEIGVRSLDSIVINNSDFATRGNGADKIHLIAAAELAVDNLRFSEQIRQITMEAMTINLKNLNFPSGSSVNLNSAYGGIDGVYPNFGTSAVGRVNFIENVKYNSHLLNNRTTFDTYGTSITIGTTGN